MGVVTRTGSSSITPGPSENDYVEGPVDVAPSPEKIIVDRGPVKDTYHTQNVMSVERFGPIIGRLRQYLEGRPTKVTYYHVLSAKSRRSHDADFSYSLIDKTFTRINDFELRLTDDLSFSFMTEEQVSQYVGTAYLYPGITPKKGDCFLMTLDDTTGRVGRFSITEVNRLTIRDMTCYSVELSLVQFMEQAEIEALEEQVDRVMYFDIQAYMGDTAVLLKTEQRQLLDDIRRVQPLLKKYYTNKFFDSSSMHAFMRPDGVFDPYIHTFLMTLYEFGELPEYPDTLLDDGLDYDGRVSTMWTALTNPDLTKTSDVSKYYKVVTKRATGSSVTIGAMLNRDYLVITDDEEDNPYISTGLFSLDGGEQTDFDKLVRYLYEQNQIDPVLLLSLAQDYHNLSDEDAFYRIPIYMLILETLQQRTISGVGDLHFEDASTYIPTEYEFTEDNLVAGWLTVNMDNKALGLIDDNGNQYLFEDEEVRYVEGSIHMNVMAVLNRRDGDWVFDDSAYSVTATWTPGESTVTLSSVANLAEGMAIYSASLGVKAIIESLDGFVATLNVATSSDPEGDQEEDVTIGWPVVENTWKAVLTGNLVFDE
jgi:hypothetical protein